MQLEKSRSKKYDIFKNAYYYYGYLPCLIALERLEKLEKYDKCSGLYTMLEEMAVDDGVLSPLRYGEEAIEVERLIYKKNGNLDQFETYMDIVPIYAEECFDYLGGDD